MKKTGALIVLLSCCGISFSQLTSDDDQVGRDGSRIISTAVPFLTISPDARAGAMADVGAATTPDAASIYWNPAKLAFIETQDGTPIKMGGMISYTPWLRRLINDMSLNYLSGFMKLRKEDAIGLSLTYFNLGDITFRDEQNQITGDFRPREFNFNFVYSRQLSKNLGVGIGAKYIFSNLTGGIQLSNGTVTKPGNTAAADVSVYYNKDLDGLATKLGLYKGNIAFGAAISNIGAKISYTNEDQADFIPTNLRMGFAATAEIDPYNKFVLAADVNKLLVPSPPIYELDSNGNSTGVIAQGQDPNRGFISGMFGSFSDAPGGFSEEMQEFIISVAAEYWYANAFAARAGYFTENVNKGNRKYFTLGLGVKYNSFGVDFAYLVPLRQNNPLQDTLRFTLTFDIPDTDPGSASSESIGDEQ